jgi:hypothetical protein
MDDSIKDTSSSAISKALKGGVTRTGDYSKSKTGNTFS